MKQSQIIVQQVGVDSKHLNSVFLLILGAALSSVADTKKQTKKTKTHSQDETHSHDTHGYTDGEVKVA